MTRLVKDWRSEHVEDTPVAEHRYRWDREDEPLAVDYKPGGDRLQRAMDERKAFFAAVLYKVGEVVYVARDGNAVKARILYVFADRDSMHELRERYRVQLETKDGYWSRMWVYTHPGFIQRGYQLAGLAPEMPAKDTR